MRTTIAIDEELVDELVRVEGGVSRSEAIRRAIQDYLRRKRIEDFMTLAGSRLVDLDWREAERQELAEGAQMRALTKRKRNVGKR